jgi:hypothetical protein
MIKNKLINIMLLFAILSGNVPAEEPANKMGPRYMGISSYFGRWADGIVPIVYNPAGAPGKFANQEETVKIIHEAFAEWENISGIHFDFLGVTNDELENYEDNRVVIAWTDLEGAVGMAGPRKNYEDYYTLGYYPYVDGAVRLHSDPKDTEYWSWWYLKSILVHELGHVIGLGHSDNPFSILYADYGTKTFIGFEIPLMQDDIEAAQALYGRPDNVIPPAVFSPPSNDFNASISDDFLFISETYKNKNNHITNITDATVVSNKDYLYLNFDFQNFPIEDVQFITINPSGYIYNQYTSSLNIQNGRSRIAWIGRARNIKAFPGIWRIYAISGNKTLFSRYIEVNTSSPEWNRPPKASLFLSNTQKEAPLTVTATVYDISDSEGDKTSVIWHVPGEYATTVEDVKAQTSKTINFPLPGTYTIYAEINDDAPRYEGAGYGFRLLKSQTITVPTQLGKALASPVLSLKVNGENITATWTAVSGATGYELFYTPYPSANQQGSLDMGSKTQITVKLPKDAAFYVSIRAYNNNGESGFSNLKHFVIK